MVTYDSFSVMFEKCDSNDANYVFQEFYNEICGFISEKKSILYHP